MNWIATLSTRERPLLGWNDVPHLPHEAGLFTATNPVAYAIDTHFLHAWKPEPPLDQLHVDHFYSHLMLRRVSDDACNRARAASYLESLP